MEEKEKIAIIESLQKLLEHEELSNDQEDEYININDVRNIIKNEIKKYE